VFSLIQRAFLLICCTLASKALAVPFCYCFKVNEFYNLLFSSKVAAFSFFFFQTELQTPVVLLVSGRDLKTCAWVLELC
jgi:hypothetical protein